MQEIEFYCKKCRKSMKISYTLTGDKRVHQYLLELQFAVTHISVQELLYLRNTQKGKLWSRQMLFIISYHRM